MIGEMASPGQSQISPNSEPQTQVETPTAPVPPPENSPVVSETTSLSAQSTNEQPTTSTPATPEMPQAVSPGVTETEMFRLLSEVDPQNQLDFQVEASLLLMAQFGIPLTRERVQELAKMNVADLAKQPEFHDLQTRNDETLLGNLQQYPDASAVTMKQTEITQALAAVLDLDLTTPEVQAMKPQEIIDKTPDPVEKNRLKTIFFRMLLAIGEDALQSVGEIDLGELFAAFFEETNTAAQGWERQRERGANAEMFSERSIDEHLHANKNMVNVLYHTFDQLSKADPPLVSSKPDFLKEDASLNQEEFLTAWTELQKMLKDHPVEAKKAFETAIGESLRRPQPEQVVVDERFYKKVEDMTTQPPTAKSRELFNRFIAPVVAAA